MKFEWIESREKQLRELYANGMPFSCIANELGCSRNAAIGKAHRLGLTPRYKVDDPDAQHGSAKGVTSGERRNVQECRVTLPAHPIEPRAKGRVGFLDLQPHHCRYSFDDGLFCGEPKARRSYCAYHADLCYVPWQRSS